MPGFFAAAHGWTAGHDLEAVVTAEELTGGDFVRTMKQLIDLARQVADVAPVGGHARRCPQGRPQRVPRASSPTAPWRRAATDAP